MRGTIRPPRMGNYRDEPICTAIRPTATLAELLERVPYPARSWGPYRECSPEEAAEAVRRAVRDAIRECRTTERKGDSWSTGSF